jgi:hypothetical protein
VLKSLLVIILVCLLVLPVRAAHSYHGIFNYKWGTSRDQIVKELKLQPSKDGHYFLLYNKNGLSLSVMFEFIEDKLVAGIFSAGVDSATPEKTAFFCDDVATNLIVENGLPTHRIQSDTLGPILRWENSDTELTMICKLSFPGKAIIIFKQSASITL